MGHDAARHGSALEICQPLLLFLFFYESTYLENSAFFFMLELHINPGSTVQPNHTRPVANGHDLLQWIKGQGCWFVWKAMF